MQCSKICEPQATLPFPLNAPANTAARTIPATPSATASGSSTVNVGNLSNQEFYYGLQTPDS